MKKVLGKEFFDRSSLVVARELLGKFLVRKIKEKEIALLITEVEAYRGPEDLASHARFGKTARTAPMFAQGGTIYIFFTYGMHYMLNLVTGKVGKPSAVLIRGAGEIVGPARLTKFLQIDKTFNHKTLGKKAGLWIEDRGVKIKPSEIKKTPRIGIAYAGEYVAKPWRFVFDLRARRTKTLPSHRL